MFLNMIDVLDVDEDVLNGWCVNDCTVRTLPFALGTTALELAALNVRDLDVGDLLVVEDLVVVDVHAEALDGLCRLLVVDVDVLLVVRLSPVELIDHALHDFLSSSWCFVFRVASFRALTSRLPSCRPWSSSGLEIAA